jgi:hypothetical protein
MQHSESIAKISAALAKAQGAMVTAAKDAKGNYGKYADLASIWEACRVPLAENEIAVIQAPGETAEKVITMTTIMSHSSGEWFKETLTIPMQRIDAQGYGSACTYARRYALAAMVGIAPAEDDGSAAAAIGGANNSRRSAPAQEDAAGDCPQDEPAPREVLEGKHSSKSALAAALRKFGLQLGKVTSEAALNSVLDEFKDDLDQCRRYLPKWWAGDGTPEKQGFAKAIDAKRAELAEPNTLEMLLDAMRQNDTRLGLSKWAANQELMIEGLNDADRRTFEREYDAYEAGLQQVAQLAAE